MPVWLRNLTYNLLEKNHQDESPDQSTKAEDSWIDKSTKYSASKDNGKITPPSYVTRASKK